MADAGDIGSYRLLRVLGTRSFATVWLAHDDVLDRQVAVIAFEDAAIAGRTITDFSVEYLDR